MLGLLFLLSGAVLAASFLRRPTAFWQKAVTAVALVTLLAVLVAWGIDLMMRTPVE